MPILAAGAKQKSATPSASKELRLSKNGSGGRARTYDMVVNSHPLCQLSYAGTHSVRPAETARFFNFRLKKIGPCPLSVKAARAPYYSSP